MQDYDLVDLRNKVGYIPQKAVLFSGDVKGNLDFGKSKETPLSEAAMWQALELAQSKNFIEDKEAGLASEVAQGEPTSQEVKDSVWPLRVPWLVSQRFLSLMTLSQPWTTRQTGSCAKS